MFMRMGRVAMDTGLFSSHTPFTPPTTEDSRLSWLRLIRSRRVGPATFHRLIADHGCADAALAALPQIARVAGVSGYAACPVDVARSEWMAGQKSGARLILWADPDYPERLRDLPDAPPVLWALGDAAVLARPMVAVVGARNASSLGARMARRLAEGLGAVGLTVVSGLARGIDTAAHGGSLGTGTVAVQAGGLDCPYPPENAELAAAIAAQGLCLSEAPPGTAPQARHFPQRNRIVWGMTLGVIVIEAAAGSGSLITARGALDLGREVMAVPGHPVDARAAGCNRLIREGATLVRDIDDVLEALGLPAAPAHPAAPVRAVGGPAAPTQGMPAWAAAALAHPSLSDLAGALFNRLGHAPMPEDDLIRDLGADPGAACAALTALELDGKVERSGGGMVRRATQA